MTDAPRAGFGPGRRLIAVGLGATLLVSLVLLTPVAGASASTWTQSNWSDGAGQTSWSSTGRFSSSLNLVTSDQDQLTLGQTMEDGTGNDGPVTVTGATDLSTTNLSAGRTCADGGDAVSYSLSGSASEGSSSLTLTTAPGPGCLAVGDEILLVDLQGGESADVASVGRYETDVVAGISGATLDLQSPLVDSYSSTDPDGKAEAVMVQRVPNYTDVTVDAGASLTASAWNGSTGGVLFFRATGTVTVLGSIDADGLGYSGGLASVPSGSDAPASTGEGVLPVESQTAGNEDGGGAGESNRSGVNDSTGGGGGGNAGNGGAGAGAGVGGGSQSGYGAAYGGDSLTSLLAGGGGGAGGGADPGCSNYAGLSPANAGLPGGSGGAGGGIIVVSAGSIVNDGTISANGEAGLKRPLNPGNSDAAGLSGYESSGDPPCGGGGGGGAGGSVFLSAGSDADLAGGTVTAAGGAGGGGVYWGGVGGGGGGGSILLSTGSSVELGSDGVTAAGGLPGTPISGGHTGGSGGAGAVEIWRPSTASVSGTTTPGYSAQLPSSYQPSGSLTSSIFDSGDPGGAIWDTLSYAATGPSGTAVAVRVRTGDEPDLSDAPAFSSCPALSTGSALSGDSCVTEGDRYAQYQVDLSGSGAATPTLTSVSISYLPAPSISKISPTAGPSGTAVVISGTGLNGATGVTIDGAAASWRSVSDAEIAATVPDLTGVLPGQAVDVAVQTSTLSATDAGGFLYEDVPTVGDVSQRVGYDSSATPISLEVTSASSVLSAAVVEDPSHGLATVSGSSISYAPEAGFSGSDRFTYSATNAAGTSTTATASITVETPALSVAPSSGVLASGTVGADYAVRLSTGGGAAPYRYSLASGSLPAGVTCRAPASSRVARPPPATAPSRSRSPTPAAAPRPRRR